MNDFKKAYYIGVFVQALAIAICIYYYVDSNLIVIPLIGVIYPVLIVLLSQEFLNTHKEVTTRKINNNNSGIYYAANGMACSLILACIVCLLYLFRDKVNVLFWFAPFVYTYAIPGIWFKFAKKFKLLRT